MNEVKITLKDLLEKPCDMYSYLYKKYRIDEEFDPIEEIKETNLLFEMVYDVAWLIKNCNKCQTQEMFEKYLDLDPDYEHVQSIIHVCNVLQTSENFKKYLDLDPDYENVSLAIYADEIFQTRENFFYYMSLSPGSSDVEWFLQECLPFAVWYAGKQEAI